ncbi:hypothetical protein DH2020_019809 [Rehmannia glutinosa]|uniref:Heme-binding protein n=1 Tax=Rehmannia glutinosa TaxID=99300 RepID=A0ABR0WFK3_REHGL
MFSSTRALCVLIFLYFVALKCKGEGYKPLPNCTYVECPQYSVIHSEKEFEIRSYKDAVWVSSPNISESSYLGGFGGAKFLEAYFGGKNVEHVKIEKTLPAFLDVFPAPIYVQNTTYIVNYYVPKKYQNNVPTPLSPQVKPVKLPKHKYTAVRRFSGLDGDGTIAEQLDTLKKSLQGTPYQRATAVNQFTVAIYYNLYESDSVAEILLSFD